ncbi:MAG: trypsin-like peptidase domain-containing protein [Deltaproteobacteria bacterium]|jgi:S1-C subfamily serine protease|nr:trypsin-like peptidase domain-containing protein [Deltaproteobacteria bacterium]
MARKKEKYRLRLIFCLASLTLAWAVVGLRPGAALGQEKFERFDHGLNESPINTRQIASKMEKGTVFVISLGKREDQGVMGSGFIVAPGYVVTNAHVAVGPFYNDHIVIFNKLLPPTPAKLIDYVLDSSKGVGGGGRDLALLKFKAPPGVDLPALSFNLDLEKMDRVGAWGYPGLLVLTNFILKAGLKNFKFEDTPVVYTEGTISALLESKFCRIAVHTAIVNEGNSGGPLVNAKGEVVGMNTWALGENLIGTAMGMAQVSEVIVKFLRKNNISPTIVHGQPDLARVFPKSEADRPGAGEQVNLAKLAPGFEPKNKPEPNNKTNSNNKPEPNNKGNSNKKSEPSIKSNLDKKSEPSNKSNLNNKTEQNNKSNFNNKDNISHQKDLLVRAPVLKPYNPKAPSYLFPREINPPMYFGEPDGLTSYRELESFYVQVPKGWAITREDRDAIVLSKNYPGSTVSLSVAFNQGLPTEVIAESYARELKNPSKPRLDRARKDTYIVNGRLNDQEAILVVSGDRASEKVSVVLMYGYLKDPGLEAILRSVVEK